MSLVARFHCQLLPRYSCFFSSEYQPQVATMACWHSLSAMSPKSVAGEAMLQAYFTLSRLQLTAAKSMAMSVCSQAFLAHFAGGLMCVLAVFQFTIRYPDQSPLLAEMILRTRLGMAAALAAGAPTKSSEPVGPAGHSCPFSLHTHLLSAAARVPQPGGGYSKICVGLYCTPLGWAGAE